MPHSSGSGEIAVKVMFFIFLLLVLALLTLILVLSFTSAPSPKALDRNIVLGGEITDRNDETSVDVTVRYRYESINPDKFVSEDDVVSAVREQLIVSDTLDASATWEQIARAAAEAVYSDVEHVCGVSVVLKPLSSNVQQATVFTKGYVPALVNF